jgi:hypothetical protein
MMSMRRIALTASALLCFSQVATAAPNWSQISFATTSSKAPQILAAADAFMSSKVGKEFPGKLLLQANTADGGNPATHTFVPIYKSMADRDAFVEKLQGNPDWTAFQGVMEKTSQPAGTVLYSNIKSWGDINDTDHTWMAHAFSVSDPAAFVAALDALLASETGKKFPGQVYLSAVVAGGVSPVTHVISVGYASATEMADWIAVRNASADWAAYQAAANPASNFLGSSMAQDLKTWGPATLKDIVSP